MIKNKVKKDKNIIDHFFIAGFGVFVSMALGLVSTPIITRIADPIEYGRFNIFNTYASILTAIVFLGLDLSLIRFFYECKTTKEKNRLLLFCTIIPVILSIVSIVILLAIKKFNLAFNELSYFHIILLILFTIASVFNTITLNLLRLTYNSSMYSICTIVQKSIYCIIIVICIFINSKDIVSILVFANIISFAISSIIAIAVTKEYWFIKDFEIPNNSKDIIKYSIPLTLFNIIFTVFDSMDKLLVKKYCSEADVGIYTSALTIVGIILLVKIAFDAIWYPAQTEHFTNDSDGKEFIRKGNRYITILMFFIGINFIMFKDVICLLLGQAYREASQYIPLLIFNPIMLAISLTTVSGIEKSKKSSIQVIISIVCLAVNYVLGTLLIPILGLKGACISVAVSFICLFGLRLAFSNKYYYIDYGVEKTIVIIATTFIFALYNTYYVVNAVTIVLYVLCLLVIWILYKNDLKEMFTFIKGSVIKNDNKE